MSSSIPYTLIRSTRRTLAIQIHDNGGVVVRAPLRTTLSYILEFLEEKKVWIQHNKEKMHARIEVIKESKEKEFISGEEFLYLGEIYILTPYDGKEIKVQKDTHILLFPRNYLGMEKKMIVKKIIEWYKKMAHKEIEALTHTYSRVTGWNYTSLRITSAQTRWGSCSGTRINFTWRLIMAPYESVEYVVVHELAHIKEKNHGKKFWSSVAHVLPDYTKRKQWLNDNQRLVLESFLSF